MPRAVAGTLLGKTCFERIAPYWDLLVFTEYCTYEAAKVLTLNPTTLGTEHFTAKLWSQWPVQLRSCPNYSQYSDTDANKNKSNRQYKMAQHEHNHKEHHQQLYNVDLWKHVPANGAVRQRAQLLVQDEVQRLLWRVGSGLWDGLLMLTVTESVGWMVCLCLGGVECNRDKWHTKGKHAYWGGGQAVAGTAGGAE
eukprot:4610021-Amphidinium_carterae.1